MTVEGRSRHHPIRRRTQARIAVRGPEAHNFAGK